MSVDARAALALLVQARRAELDAARDATPATVQLQLEELADLEADIRALEVELARLPHRRRCTWAQSRVLLGILFVCFTVLASLAFLAIVT
jgi:hypothetical protein